MHWFTALLMAVLFERNDQSTYDKVAKLTSIWKVVSLGQAQKKSYYKKLVLDNTVQKIVLVKNLVTCKICLHVSKIINFLTSTVIP